MHDGREHSPQGAGGEHRSIGEDERQLLVRLLTESQGDGTGVDAVTFRARHHKQLRVLEQMEADRLIRREQDRYFVGLLALVRIDLEPARQVLSRSEQLYSVLRSRYVLSPREPVPLAELAAATNSSIEDTRQTLRYMLESPTWCSGRSEPMTSPDAFVRVSEGVLDHETFASLIDQLEEWREGALRQRKSWRPLSFPDFGDAPTLEGHALTARSSRPPWIGSLPPEIADVMSEVYTAIDIGLRALPSMGMRAALDLLFARLLGSDQGTFEQKVKALCDRQFISTSERDHVYATIDAGSASAHRGHVPDQADVQTILVICERLLQAHFVLPEATRRLKTNTPPRAATKRRPS